MDDLTEKRVYTGRDSASEVLIAAGPGLLTVSVSAGRIGGFRLVRRCAPADVAVAPPHGRGPRLAVATDDDVWLAPAPAVSGLESSGFGSTAAVSFDDDTVVAAAADGRVARYDGTGWTTVGELPASPNAVAGDLVATDEGTFRLTDAGLRPSGLKGVTDVARTGGIPLAATDHGLYELGNGWLEAETGDFRLVAGTADGQAHAATADAFYERIAGGWQRVELPADGPVGAVAYGDGLSAVTIDGDFLHRDGERWRVQPLGVDGVVAAAAV